MNPFYGGIPCFIFMLLKFSPKNMLIWRGLSKISNVHLNLKKVKPSLNSLHPQYLGILKCLQFGPWNPRIVSVHHNKGSIPEGNLVGRGKSRGERGWIFQYLLSFCEVLTFSHRQFLGPRGPLVPPGPVDPWNRGTALKIWINCTAI